MAGNDRQLSFKGQGEIANSKISKSKSAHFGSSLHVE